MDDIEAATRDFGPETTAILGAAIEVHRRLGPGFLEAVYHEALEVEFARCGIPFLHEVPMPIWYRGALLRTVYRADFVCYRLFIVELKAQAGTSRADEAQVVNYLRASGLEVGLLLNFATPTLSIRRLTNASAHPFPVSPGSPEAPGAQPSSTNAAIAKS